MTTRRVMMTSLFASLSAACSPLTMFNTLVPKDGARRPGRDIAFGPDPRQKLDVYTPRRGAKAAPVLLFFYGGSWNSGRRQDYAFVGRAFAAKGFVTVIADYRLVPEVHFPTFVEDGALAIAWAQKHAGEYGGDPARIVLAGHSAGAYNAMMLALAPDYVRRAGGDPAAIKAVAGLAGPYDFLPLDVDSTRAAFGQFGDLPATQPVNLVGPGAPPAFLGHGDVDTLVRKRNATALARAYKAAGDEVEVKFYDRLDHAGILLALARPLRGRAPVLDDVSAFLMRHAS